MALVLCLAACQNEVEMQMVEIPLSLALPMTDNHSSPAGMPHRRVLGDPGGTEILALPQYAYIFVVIEYESGTPDVYSQTIELDVADWDTIRYAGSLQHASDYIFSYKKRIIVPMKVDRERKEGRVYAAMSSKPLTLNKPNPTTEEQVRNIVFTVSEMQDCLQDIYSSPYNYNVGGKYYGTIKNIKSKVPSIDLLLYHVATKVDLMYNVPSELQTRMKVIGLTINNLYNNDAYLFRPTENTVSAATYTAGYSQTLSSNSAGTWWQFRNSLYTIPYKNSEIYFPIQLTYTLEDMENSTNNTYNLILKKNMTDASDVFVPWLRGQMMFTEVKTGSETKTVE